MTSLPVLCLDTVTPRDIPLPLPLPAWLLLGLLVFSFLLHILFVNLMLGGSILTLWLEWRGRREKALDTLAREIARTVTVNKSLAVVLGVAPLLSINVFYTLYFYSANILTARAWILVIPLVASAFLLLYLHKYSWDRLAGRKTLHLAILGGAVLIFLCVPLIFLTNINLMQFPLRWKEVHGFLTALVMRNVIPRYLHFLTASLAVSGLFLFGWMRRRAYPFAERLPDLDRHRVLKGFYQLAFFATLAQLAMGPLNLFTLPWFAVTWTMVGHILAGLALALSALYLLWSEIKGPPERLGRRFVPIVLILTFTVMFMGVGRQIYRATALAPHQQAVQESTRQYEESLQQLPKP
jgi:cytochrome c